MLDYSPFSRPSAALVCAAVLSFISCLAARVSHDVVSNTPLRSHQRSHFTGHQRSSSQTGTFRGAPSQEMSTTAHNPPGLSYNRNFADDRKSRAGVAGMRGRPVGSIPTSHFRQKGRGHDGRHSGGNSGVKATGITRKSSFQETSRLWQPSQGPDGTRKSYSGRVQSYASYLETLQQIPESDYGGSKETNKMATVRPYGGLKISKFLVSGRQPAPQVPPKEINQIYSRNKKLPRGKSYLFNQPQNSTTTVKQQSSAISFSRDQQRGSAETQTPAHPAKGTEAENAASSQEAAVNGHVSGATHVSKPTQTPKRLFGYRGFEHHARGANKEPSKQDSGQRGFDKGRFTMSNLYPALLAKYKFSRIEKQEGAQRDPSLTAQRPFTPGSKETHLRVPGSVNESNPHQRHFSTYRISRLQGFDSPTLEGAKPLIHKSDKPVKVQRGLEGFFQTNSHIWGSEKSQIHRWYKGTGAGGGDVSATGGIRGEHPKVPSKTNGSTEEEFTLDRYRKNRKIFTFLTLHLNQTHQEFKEQNHPRISPGNFRTAGNQTELAAKPEPPRKPHQSTRSDDTNTAISRAPARPAGLWSFNYTDVLGKASFSGVGVTVKMLAAGDAPAMTLLTET